MGLSPHSHFQTILSLPPELPALNQIRSHHLQSLWWLSSVQASPSHVDATAVTLTLSCVNYWKFQYINNRNDPSNTRTSQLPERPSSNDVVFLPTPGTHSHAQNSTAGFFSFSTTDIWGKLSFANLQCILKRLTAYPTSTL